MKLLNNIFNSIKNRILVSISFALLFLQSNAQIYPVQISGQLTPPYSGFIQDYAEPGSEQLRIILHFNDFSKSNYDVKLKFVIKGNGFSMSSKQFLNLSPISLNPGQPILISGSDLAPYLSANNLDFVGINQSSYIQNKSLPEGYYSICITAFDYNTNIKVSNEFCVNAWFTYSNPPLLNFPVCNSNIAPLNPQNILFQWTPVNVGSPNSALNTVYDFMLYEIRPDSNANPNQIVLSTAPIFSTTVSQPFLNYGIVEPNLNLYMKYVWRVRVRDITGRDWFTNNGFSQICTFTYGSASNVLGGASKLSLNTNAISHRMGKADWNKQASFSSYRLQVKKQGTENWFDFIVNESTEKIPNLEPNTTYVCRVRGEGTFTGDWSEESEFTTPNEPNYSCNNANFFPDILNAKPLPIEKAISGMIIQTGQFEVLVEQIAPNGPPGWYKGNGRAQSLSGLFVNVKWEAIYIDDNQRHQQGIIEAETKGVDKWLQQWDLVQAQENAHYTDGKIDSIYINGNQVCYTFPGNSNEICVPTPSNSNVMVVRDSEGNEYQIQLVPAPPKIVGKSNYFNFSSDSLNCNDSLKVVFKGLNNQQFGFDEKQYAAWHDNYEIIKLKTTNYFVPNKSVGHSETDVVMAEITLPYFEEKDLSFKTGKNNTLNYELLGQTKAIVKDIPADAGYIYAYYKNKKVGKLTIVSLDKLEKELVLVPVNGTNLDINKDSLNKTFAQANVTWKVNVAANFNYDLGNDGLEAADASLFSKYSDEMRALRDAYVKHDTAYNKKAYYVFIVPKFNNPEVKGYMVRGRAVGFMTPLSFGKGSGDRLLAHELSHGAFGLEHSFPKLEKNNTNNLMDYGEGKQLVKSQWYAIQGSKPIFNWFDEEEDGSYTKPEIASAVFYWINKIKVAYKKRTTVKIPKADFAKDINRLNHFAVYNTQLGGIDFKFIRILFLTKASEQEMQIVNSIKIDYENKLSAHIEKDAEYLIIDNGKFAIEVPKDRAKNMKYYIENTQTFKNLLLFVNGYRPVVNFNGDPTSTLLEYADTDNSIDFGDSRGYWKGIDKMFIDRIGTRQAIYADGHHNVGTSNHKNVANYLAGNLDSDKTRLECGIFPFSPFCNTSVYLHTEPNIEGFNVRLNSGKHAGEKIVSMIKSSEIIFDKNKDTLDIVAHSMGYAYSVGMIQALEKAKIKFGRFYIIAPENACSGGPNWKLFEETWQYGSNLGEKDADPPYLQDGVAPQCKCKDFPTPDDYHGRIFIPENITTKSFLGSHSISNYGWIFTERTIGKTGYVKSRN